MIEILELLKQYGIEIGDYQFITNDRSYKEGNIIYYQNICDGLTLAATNIENIDIKLKRRGIMVDVSRGQVYTVKTLKRMIINSACMGYNYMTLYIEDLINLPNFQQYGYMRGRYSDNEIKELIDFANNLDYQIIPAFQTLGHLEHFLKWDVSNKVKATEYSLDPLKEETYLFLDELISRMVDLFGQKSLHLGMDEVFDLGFNRFKTGNVDQKRLFLDHLKAVVEICNKKGVENIKIWSDMLFSIYSNTDGDNLFSLNIGDHIEQIDQKVELVYWDYWTVNPEHINKVISAHKKFNSNISMAAAIHTSGNIVYNHQKLEATNACLCGIDNTDVDDILFTMWSEDGTNVAIDTILFGMYETMNLMFNSKSDPENFKKITNYNYSDMVQICNLQNGKINPIGIIWNDPVYDIYYNSFENNELEVYLAHLMSLKYLEEKCELNTYYNHLLKFLRLDIHRYLTNSNSQNDLITVEYKFIKQYLENQWIINGKLHGIEEIQKRFGLKLRRYQLIEEKSEYLAPDGKLEGHVAPRFSRLYGPNKWRF